METPPARPTLLKRYSRAIHSFYARHERALGLSFFLGGIVWDALTLRTIDNPIDNLILIGYLVGLTTVIILDIRARSGRFKLKRIDEPQALLRGAIQFLLGALLSAYVIFYSRSITWSTHLAFWLILVIGMVANEFLTRKLSSFPAQIALLFFASVTMMAWLLPVALAEMSLGVFRLAIGLSLLLGFVVYLVGRKAGRVISYRIGHAELWVLASMALLLDVGYRANWIPPVPLSVQEGGIYNSVIKENGTYRLEWTSLKRSWLSPDYARTVIREEGEPVYCFTAVFAPTRLEETIYHVWKRKDVATGKWIESDRIGYRMTGGRKDGYRGSTFKRNLTPGQWRVVVVTEDGKVLTRVPFDIPEETDDGDRWRRTLVR